MSTPEDHAVAAGHSVEPARWRAKFDRIMARIAVRFGRVEPRAIARTYLLGLLSHVERKNCRQLAEQAGHVRPGPMQRLPRCARWDADAARDDIRTYAVERLGADGCVLIMDETGFVKKGRASAGFQRQYTGTAGRIENSQVGVFLAYATSRGRALIDRRLYLTKHSWCTDSERRQAAGTPGTVPFATKPRPAWKVITAVPDAGVEAPWASGDGAYGQDPQLRAGPEARGTGYVMAVACSTRVWINQGRTPVRADTVAERLTATAWQRQGAGPGAKGPAPPGRGGPTLTARRTAPEGGGESGVRTGVEAGQAREATTRGDGGRFLSGLMRPGRQSSADPSRPAARGGSPLAQLERT
ncbi:IS701 family transposase [Streptomyces sp. NPDC058861]|uniref:IS701 family transposase n=1 Tax=Streptomyces sp. NPDC058861 TaxID=3346653 RepID=UPI00368D7A3D